MQEILKHLASGGTVIGERGHTLVKNKTNHDFTYAGAVVVSDANIIVDHLAYGEWKVVPEYADGIYIAKCLKSGGELTLIKQDGKWQEADLGGCSKAYIKDYSNITHIGDLPKEPTVADKIAAVTNDFVPDWGDAMQNKYSIKQYGTSGKWHVLRDNIYKSPSVTYFRTKEEAQRVIDEVLL